jgi:hypothetical protein
MAPPSRLKDAKQKNTTLYPLFTQHHQQVARRTQQVGVNVISNHHYHNIPTKLDKILLGTRSRFKEDFPSHGKNDFLNECDGNDYDDGGVDDDDDDDNDDVPLSMLADRRPNIAEADQPVIVEGRQHPFFKRPNKRKRSDEVAPVSAFLVEREVVSVEIIRNSLKRGIQPVSSSWTLGNTAHDLRKTQQQSHMSMPHKRTLNDLEPPKAAVDDNSHKPCCARVSLSPATKISSSSPIRRRRIFSDSSMDFVPADPPASRMRNNVLLRLLSRSSNGYLLHKTVAYGGMSNQTLVNKRSSQPQQSSVSLQECPTWMMPSKWKTPTWLSLAQPMEYSSKTKNVDHMVWDEVGVLLAVAQVETISIYDWDMVRAADLQGRRDRCRKCRDSQWNIEPIVQFKAPSSVTKLVWNPFHPDELAVGLR